MSLRITKLWNWGTKMFSEEFCHKVGTENHPVEHKALNSLIIGLMIPLPSNFIFQIRFEMVPSRILIK